ncbi:MAG: cell wall hydrolase, partial [Bdellovibrionales bacterium]
GGFGSTVAGVCRKPSQFSAWNSNDPNFTRMLSVTSADPKFKTALEIAEKALLGILPDVTGGADHYLNIAVTKKIRGGTLPSWVDLRKKTAAIGSHTFLKLA